MSMMRCGVPVSCLHCGQESCRVSSIVCTSDGMGWHYMGHVQGRASNRDILVNNCTNVNVFNENGCSASLKKHIEPLMGSYVK